MAVKHANKALHVPAGMKPITASLTQTQGVIGSIATQGMVLYCDGGARPNPGPGGWGMHGYLYLNQQPLKPAGNADHILTTSGYVTKIEAGIKLAPMGYERRVLGRFVEVTPIHYINGYGSFAEPITNNVAELAALINGLIHARDYDISEIQIFTDSEYARKCFEYWMDVWFKNGWRKEDQTEPSNIAYLKSLMEARDLLRQRGVKIKVNWVKGHTDAMEGHADILGNILVDKLATVGVMGSKQGMTSNSIELVPAEGYWKYTADRHPFIFHRRMYFNTISEYVRPGEYYLGNHGKDDDLLGTRMSDGAYAVVILQNHDSILELVRNHQVSMAANTDAIMMARLDHLYRAETHQEIMRHGTLAMEQKNQYRLDLACLDREPLTRELKAPKLAMRAIEAIGELAAKLNLYLHRDESLVLTDLTPVLYDTTIKVSKKAEAMTTLHLKPEYNVGYAALKIEANYEVPGGTDAVPVTLTLGIDLPDRNSLKRLEEFQPTVTLITWLEAPGVFRYATVLQAIGDVCITAGAYSNLRIVPAVKTA